MPMDLDQFCRRQWRRRSDAIRAAVEDRQSKFHQAAVPAEQPSTLSEEARRRLERALRADSRETS